MYELPTTVTVNNQLFHIRRDGDFRMILDCFSAMQDSELSKDYRIMTALMIFYADIEALSDIKKYTNCLEALCKEMFKFINCGQEGAPGAERDVSVINWNDDSQLVCAAINNVANQEVRILSYLHWWTFMGYYMSVGQSVLSTVVGIRDKLAHHKKLEQWEKDFRKENPQYFTRKQSAEEQEWTNQLQNLWNKGGDINAK